MYTYSIYRAVQRVVVSNVGAAVDTNRV